MPELDDLIDDLDGDNDLVRSLRKALKDSNKELKELRDQAAKAAKENRTRSLADVLRDKGLDAKVAKLYPSDSEATPEAVDAWLGEYGDVFGIGQSKPETTATPEQIAAAQSVSGAAASAPPANPSFDVHSIIAEINGAKSQAELDAIYKKVGLK